MLSEPHSLSRAGRGRPGSVHPACPALHPTTRLPAQLCPAPAQIPKPFKKSPTSKHPPTLQPQQKTLRTLLFWVVVVVVYFKNLEESLLQSIHCLLSFLFMGTEKNERDGKPGLPFQIAEGRKHMSHCPNPPNRVEARFPQRGHVDKV